MITLTAVGGVALVELGMVLIPGPNMVHLVSRAITQGRRAGLVSLGGTAVGFLCYLLAAAAGLSALFAAVPVAFTAVNRPSPRTRTCPRSPTPACSRWGC